MSKIWISIIILISIMLLISSCSSSTGTTAPTTGDSNSGATTAPSSSGTDGKSLLEDRCTKCHSLDRITSRSGTIDEWTGIVDQMVQKGAVLSADEQATLIQYLADTYK